VEHAKREQQILSSIQHTFIVKLEAAFQDKFFLYLAMEFVPGGNLLTWMYAARRPPYDRRRHLRQVTFFASQIVLVLQFLHGIGIVHRDLKPANLLIGADGYLRLADFGFAKRLDKKPYRTSTICGSPDYMAPEVLGLGLVKGQHGYSFSVDWWSLGIVLFELISKDAKPPFRSNNLGQMYQKMAACEIDWPTVRFVKSGKRAHCIPQCARDLISQLLIMHVPWRMGIHGNGVEDVMQHPFFKDVDWEGTLQKSINVPDAWKPTIKSADDTQHYHVEECDENTDTENQELDYDPFEQLQSF